MVHYVAVHSVNQLLALGFSRTVAVKLFRVGRQTGRVVANAVRTKTGKLRGGEFGSDVRTNESASESYVFTFPF